MRVKDLQLRAKLIVDGLLSNNGLHRSLRHGSSVEFSEYREYSPGDDTRALDWKRFGRTDRYYIKKFEDETNRTCFLVVDQSQSMGFGSLDHCKLDYARTLAATLAHYLTLQRDQVGLMTFDESVADVVVPRNRPGQMRQILACLDRPPTGRGTTLTGPLQQIAALARRRGLVVVVSDLLTPADDLRPGLAMLRGRGHEVVLLRILDPAEREFTAPADRMIVDMETGRQIHVDEQTAAASYAAAFARHAAELQTVCDSLAVTLFDAATDHPVGDALSRFLSTYNRRRGGPRRGGMIAGGAS